jgi:Flp pilus assembly protein TadB
MMVAGLVPLRPARSGRLVPIGDSLIKLLRLSRSSTPLRQDLNVLHRSDESLAIATALAAIVGATGPAVLYAAAAGLGLHAPSALVGFACVAGGLAGAAVPSLLVRQSAGVARQDLVHSLACWLELVALAQAGGMGVESALEAASSVTGEASFARIRRALDRARDAGRSPWDALDRLGAELGVNELEELAASVRLAGAEGARIRSSLSAKSASLRRRQTANAQGRANAATERLFLPSIVLMLGFVVFLMYPAGVTLSRVL